MIWTLAAVYWTVDRQVHSQEVALFDDLAKLEAYLKTSECRKLCIDEDFTAYHVHRWVPNEIPERVPYSAGYHPRHREYTAEGTLIASGEDSE